MASSTEFAIDLPTFDKLGFSSPPSFADVDARQIATSWLEAFSSAVQSNSTESIVSLFAPDSWWRDILTLTWDIRTFRGHTSIQKLLSDRLKQAGISKIKLKDDFLGLQQPFPDIAWVNLLFDFETNVGNATGVARLVPISTPNGVEWKAHVLLTLLEDLKGHPEQLGPLRNHSPDHGEWESKRAREREFLDSDPKVLIVGAGHNGLGLAARLKVLGVSSLVVDKNQKVGDNWANRYEALCLHDPVYADHLPYLPFPPTWPAFTPALKLAKWLEHYAEALEINTWTSTTVLNATQNESDGKWNVTVQRKVGDVVQERVFIVNHLVFATGYGSGVPHFPTYPGQDKFKGQILHSTAHKRASDHAGKKVVVIGSCTAGHDLAVDYCKHGVDVTMYQRSSTYVMSTKAFAYLAPAFVEGGPPTADADRLVGSYPYIMFMGLAQRLTKMIAEGDDKETLEGLHKVGFKTNLGPQGTGIFPLFWTKCGGYYIDTGGSKYIIDGSVKLKNDSQLASFDESGLVFENGSHLDADVVVFATGLGNAQDVIRKVCGPAVADKYGPVWGLNEEGELQGVWRDANVKGLWYMLGNFAFSRFHSKHVSLQIKAMEEGIFGERYTA
ncbi:FAD/NAD(P)-binding domain-containing protein [Pluteus cervinus]|uniref:FAD/NAD(P)-binding domain-containing protein n=1 Tax=Pluteus cervinus TaxID=181527 RepID=A0ACD3AYM2_9AGAR|nr:FAD/NAD(P)-binding domain-containing protein [Pluteus cervinus]